MRHTYYLVIRRTVSVEDADEMTMHEVENAAKEECLADLHNLTVDGIEIEGKEVE